MVSPAYDSLVAKLMAHGRRPGTAPSARLSRALRALELDGLETNRDLLPAVLDDDAFRRGDVDIHYLERRTDLRDAAPARRGAPAPCRRGRLRAARRARPPRSLVPGAGGRAGATSARPCTPTSSPTAAGTVGCGRRDRTHPVAVLVRRASGRTVGTGRASARDGVGGPRAAGRAAPPLPRAPGRARGVFVNGPEGQSTLRPAAPRTTPTSGAASAGECRAPLPGAVTKVLVAVGDVVAEGDGLVVLEAMKMEHTLRADGAGTVAQVAVRAGAAGRRGRPAGVGGAGVSAPRRAGPLRIANCSGFFGDRLSAAREMVEGGPIDVLTGDWLAELTMYILHKTRERSGGYARTFLRELEDVLPTCIERGHHGRVQRRRARPRAAWPRRCASWRDARASRSRVASVSGDDITPRLAGLRAPGERLRQSRHRASRSRRSAAVVTANAYLRPGPSPTPWRPARRSWSRAG